MQLLMMVLVVVKSRMYGSIAVNYAPGAGCDDGSCIYNMLGCTDPTACNYDPAANQDDGSCLTDFGCTDPSACNYNSLAQNVVIALVTPDTTILSQTACGSYTWYDSTYTSSGTYTHVIAGNGSASPPLGTCFFVVILSLKSKL